MTSDDNNTQELFSLCKKVYELTGWRVQFGDWYDVSDVPMYDSDFLLEKLTDYDLNMYHFHDEGWRYSVNEGDHEVGSDTPLKALLKLTIALKESGEL